MNKSRNAVASFMLAVMLAGGTSFAQDRPDDRDHHPDQNHGSQNKDRHDDHGFVRHKEWRKGYHMKHEDWDRGARVDYSQYHLRQPPSGYEWRAVDGNYVLAAVATGVIASVIVASSAR